MYENYIIFKKITGLHCIFSFILSLIIILFLESKGQRERKRIIDLLKQDVKGKVNQDEYDARVEFNMEDKVCI